MLCPYCDMSKDKVVDSRTTQEGEVIRRRRLCLACNRRFTTYERVEDVPIMVKKKDLRRERFDRQKVMQGLLRACEKRPVSMSQVERMVRLAERLAIEAESTECTTREIGALLMEELRDVDRVAYVRFASVYRDFQDEREFLVTIQQMLKQDG